MTVAASVARWSGTFPEVQHYIADATNGAAIVVGSFVKTDTDGEIIICGADPAAVLGIALGDFNGAAGYGMPSGITQVTGRSQEIPVALGTSDTIFAMKGSSAPVLTNIGDSFGVVLTSGIWTVDITDTTNKVVVVVDIDTDRADFFVKIHEDIFEHSVAT